MLELVEAKLAFVLVAVMLLFGTIIHVGSGELRG